MIVALVIFLVVAVVGGVGYGIYALSHKPLTAAQQQQANATATAQSNVLLNDPLTSDVNNWPSSDTHCFINPDGYHISNGYYCEAPIGDVGDGSVTVTAKEIAGSTLYPYGIVFRLGGDQSHYSFMIDSNSKWVFFKIDASGKATRLKDYTANTAIHGGLNASNTLKVDFRGETFTCSVNDQMVGVVTDVGTPLGSGKIGLEAGDNVTAVFTNFIATQ
jgi:hypothetical protein